MLLVEATWMEIEAYLATSRAIVMPIGSVEQHGPMGLIGTDAMCADIIARRAGDLGGFLAEIEDRPGRWLRPGSAVCGEPPAARPDQAARQAP